MFEKSQIRFDLAKTRLRAPLVWLRHRSLRPSDVLIASYPRSGSTWLRFLLFDLLSGQESDFPSVQLGIPGVENASTARTFLTNSGRLLQTHEFYRKEYRKAVYLVRDVRDVLISEYYFWLRRGVFKDDFNAWFERFMNSKVNPYGYWGSHVNSWFDAPITQNGQVLFVKFEEMRLNTEAVFAKIVEFLGFNYDLSAIRGSIQNNTLERMRAKESRAPQGTFRANRKEIPFIRQGSAGGWQDTLTEMQLKLIEERLGNTLNRLGYSLDASFESDIARAT